MSYERYKHLFEVDGAMFGLEVESCTDGGFDADSDRDFTVYPDESCEPPCIGIGRWYNEEQYMEFDGPLSDDVFAAIIHHFMWDKRNKKMGDER